MHQLTIFYDSYCPLCIKEMQKLASFDENKQLNLVDIQAPDFSRHYPDVDPLEANRILLGQDENGAWLRGLDVSLHAWTIVGKGHRVFFLRWVWLRPVLNLGYSFFARHRYLISGLLTGKQRCERCEIQSKRCQ